MTASSGKYAVGGLARLEKTADACQARMNLLLSRMKAGNTTALRKFGTEQELDNKCALIAELATHLEEHGRANDKGKSLTAGNAHVSVTTVRREAAMLDLVERVARRRLELMKQKINRELAAQKCHSDDRVAQCEKLHREQKKIQLKQHARLLASSKQCCC